MPFTLMDRVAVVTGASRGIGRATALILAAAGSDLVLLGRDSSALAEVAAGIRAAGRTALVVEGDLATVRAAEVTAAALERFGRLDILVNNAAMHHAGPIEDVEDETWQALLAINLTAVYHLCRAAVVPMRAQGWGRIVNIASITAQTGGVSGSIAYSATKGGVLALTRTLARDVAAHGVTVNAVAPGQIDTGMGRRLSAAALAQLEVTIPLGRLGTPDEVGYTVLFLASQEAAYITGATIDVNGGLLKR